MTEPPPSERFKAEMPQIPGVTGKPTPRAGGLALRLVAGLIAALAVIFAASRFLSRKPHKEAVVEPPPQIQVAAPPPDPNAGIPTVSDAQPTIAQVSEMAKPWSSQAFFYRNNLNGSVPALLIRLPTGSANQANGYWGLSMNAAYGNCKLEYVTDLEKLRTDYDYRSAKHPMVGNPCSRTLFDPTRLMGMPGNVFVRGLIVQGSDLRPPLAIEVDLRGKEIVALRME